jgi:hypothetical protein
MTENSDRPTRQRVTLTDISSRAWEHPADRGALVALRQLKGFDYVLRKMSGLINERAFRLQYLGSAIRVDERQFPTVNRLYTEAASTLDVRQLPELYVTNSPIWNAVTIGMDKPFIVVNSALLQGLDEEELRFVLGHELGHAQSGHALYQSLLLWLMRLTGAINWMPIGALGLRAIIAALHEWSRKAELSGDRAGLLAVQESAGDLRDSVLKLLLLEAQSHPLAVIRAHELRRWVDEGEYTTIVSGEYPKRQDDGDASISQEAKNAAKSYTDAFNRSQDPLAKFLRDLGDGLGGVRDWVSSKFPPRT